MITIQQEDVNPSPFLIGEIVTEKGNRRFYERLRYSPELNAEEQKFSIVAMKTGVKQK